MKIKHLMLIALLVVAPILVAAAAGPETTGTFISMAGSAARAIEWESAAGPADYPVPVANGVPSPQGLTAHEWGTFTSSAGADGQAIDVMTAPTAVRLR